ncbi:hypothetical protein ACX0G9_07020 [Flavitalea flava]
MSHDLSKLRTRYEEVKLQEVLHYDKFNEFSVLYNAASIEGTTFMDTETQLLLDEDLTPKGKP